MNCQKKCQKNCPKKCLEFPLENAELYRNTVGRWYESYKALSRETQKKQSEFRRLYVELDEKLQLKGKNHFDKLLLLSYYESIVKMQKNKAKYYCMTYFWMALEAFFSLIIAVGSVISVFGGIEPLMSAVEKLVSHLFKTQNSMVKQFIEKLVSLGIIIFAVAVLIFICHKLISICMREFKPKETWIRHNKQCYRLSMEVMHYLDHGDVYLGLDENEAYMLFQSRVKNLWQENLEKFWNAMGDNS